MRADDVSTHAQVLFLIELRDLDDEGYGLSPAQKEGLAQLREEMDGLAEALPFAKALTTLKILGNPRVTSRGWDALSTALEAGCAPKVR